ncbi:MAG: hypothetical protein HOV87_21650, partial [Catenulispora sp.]|nr:hypothetical protein [Catenulispora sp.]
MNDEFLRRPARDVDPDQLPDYGFGGEPLFRDEVPPAGGAPEFSAGAGAGPAVGATAGAGAGTAPGESGFHDASLFREPGQGGNDHGGNDAGVPGGAGQWTVNEGPLRVVPADQASALLRIKLPDAPPVPATTLRSDAPIETVVEAAQMLHRVSPARPNALPGDVLALTTATMVVPLPGAAFGGVRTVPRSPARLTASVPPDLASRAEADLLSDTVEQFFGDFDAIGRALQAQRAGGAAQAGAGPGASAGFGAAAGSGAGAGFATAERGPEASQAPAVPGQYTPSAPSSAPGRYGVPTQFPGYDAARRSPVGMRYLGGIFHDSSGESSFYDPATESLVPMGAGAFSAADFRRIATSG